MARALEESEGMVVLLTPARQVSSPDIKRNIKYAFGAKNYSNRLISVVVGEREHIPAAEVRIVRRMPWFELYDTDTEPPRVEPIAEAILSHA